MRPLPDGLPRPASGVPILAPDEVHVWTLSLDASEPDLPAFTACLAELEHARAARFRFEEDRNRYIAGRGCARALIAAYGGGDDPAQLRLEEGAHGKPYLVDPRLPLSFNWSHSGSVVMIAVSTATDVGVDVERLHRATDIDQVAERVFSPAELSVYRALEGEARRAAFFNGWTRKEAFIKATGEGLSRPLREFDVELRPGELARLLAIGGDPVAAREWTLHGFTPRPGYQAAVAVRAPAVRLRLLDWRR